MYEDTDDAEASGGAGGRRSPRNLPSWAWAVIGVLAGALLVGLAWAAYESGRAAGSEERGTSRETSVPVAARIVTPAAEDTEALADARADIGGDAGTPPADAGTYVAPEAPKTPIPSVTPTAGLGGLKLESAHKVEVGTVIPALWKNVFSSMGSGDWTGPVITLKKGQVRLKLKISGGDQKFLYVGLRHIAPPAIIEWMWGTEYSTDRDVLTPPIPIEAGQYRVEVLAKASGWSVTLQQ